MIKKATLLFCAFWTHSFGLSDPKLKVLTEFAGRLEKSKDMGAPAAYCEYTVSNRIGSCGGKENEYLVRSNGLVEMRIFKSYKEGPEPRPGLYQGRFPKEKWRELLSKVSKMRWDSTQQYRAMPSRDEYVSTLALSDGKQSVAYSLIGQEKSSSIEDGMYEPGIIAQNASDTIWSMSLVQRKSKITKGILEVKVAWKVYGNSPVSLAAPFPTGTQGCVSTMLKWREEKSDGFGETGILQAEAAASRDTSWTKADEKSTVNQTHRFKLPKAFSNGKRSGKILQTGVLVKSADSKSPMTVDLYSEWFSF
jgi:hypothetical protein